MPRKYDLSDDERHSTTPLQVCYEVLAVAAVAVCVLIFMAVTPY